MRNLSYGEEIPFFASMKNFSPIQHKCDHKKYSIRALIRDADL